MSKATNNLTMIYDDSCPMCNIYTKAFTRNNWIGNRCGFSTVSEEVLKSLDLNKSKNEIPLYDATTHITVYGIDALMTVLGNRFPVLKPLFLSIVFRFLVRKLYYFISFNRRIIAGTLPSAKGFDCTPAVNVKYRIYYMVFASLLGGYLFYSSGLWMMGAALSAYILISAVFHQQALDYIGHSKTIFLLTGIIAAILSSFIPVYFVMGLTLVFFIFFYAKRVQLIQKVHQEKGRFRVGFTITKGIIEICKLVLLLKAKKYHKENLPVWLNVPMSHTDEVGKDFYLYYAKENNFVLKETNSKGLCRLEDLNSKDFDAGLVNKKIKDFYAYTHLFEFGVEQKWDGWLTWPLRIFIKYYNSVSQQFNFNHIEADKTSTVANLLTPIQTSQGEMMSWARQNITSNTTMFAGFYQADQLPFDREQTCVTTRFPLLNACLMVKLKPVNDTNGDFSFQSEDTEFGRYSFYVVMRYHNNYYVTTLPVQEILSVKEINHQLEVDHQFKFFHRSFMKFKYHIKNIA